MSPEVEKGFGTGLRAQLRLKQGDVAPAPEATPPIEPVPEPEPEAEQQLAAPEPALVDELRAELEEALEREQHLREALQHHIEAHERELAAGRDCALQEAGVEIGRASCRERV